MRLTQRITMPPRLPIPDFAREPSPVPFLLFAPVGSQEYCHILSLRRYCNAALAQRRVNLIDIQSLCFGAIAAGCVE
jgi:hypothetical protein